MIESLADLALRHLAGSGGQTIPRMGLHVAREPSLPIPTLYRPMLCVVLQGAKRVMIGDRILCYDAESYFVGSIEVPASGCIVEASHGRPYVSASLAIDQDCLSSLLADEVSVSGGEGAVGFAVSPITPALRDAWARLLRLLDDPVSIPVLAPLIEREILYRLLQGPQGMLLRRAARSDSRLSRVRRAIDHLRAHYDRAVRIEELAGAAGMSLATFHRHFRAATAMTPLQYQKSLRLQEARRRLVTDGDASRTAYAVGYESASQFSREYARMFGAPPGRDAERLRRLGELEVLAA